MCTLHPASTSSATATRLCGISSTRKAFRALGGSFFSINSNVLVVVMGTWDGVFREMLLTCSSAILHLAFLPKMVNEAPQSRYAVSRSGSGGFEQIASLRLIISLSQPGGSLLTSTIMLFVCNSTPAGATCHPRPRPRPPLPAVPNFAILAAFLSAISTLMASLPGNSGQSDGM